MTDDDIPRGPNQDTVLSRPYESVLQPNYVQTVVASVQTNQGRQLWKFSTCCDNPQFWSTPGAVDKVLRQVDGDSGEAGRLESSLCVTTEKTRPVPEQYEMYNLTDDPLELVNLAHPQHDAGIEADRTGPGRPLVEQCQQKRLVPTSGTVAGMPSCSQFDPFGSTNLLVNRFADK